MSDEITKVYTVSWLEPVYRIGNGPWVTHEVFLRLKPVSELVHFHVYPQWDRKNADLFFSREEAQAIIADLREDYGDSNWLETAQIIERILPA